MTRPFASWVGYRAAAGRSTAAGGTTNLLSPAPPHHPPARTLTPPHEALALRAVAGCPIHSSPFATWMGYRAAAGRSAAAGGTTNLLSSAPAHHHPPHKPSPHHAKPLAVRAGPGCPIHDASLCGMGGIPRCRRPEHSRRRNDQPAFFRTGTPPPPVQTPDPPREAPRRPRRTAGPCQAPWTHQNRQTPCQHWR
jgi:hypothetical protein